MNPIISKQQLLENLENVLTLEEQAKKSYDSDIELFNEKAIVDALISVRNDEIKHIKILKDLISMLKK